MMRKCVNNLVISYYMNKHVRVYCMYSTDEGFGRGWKCLKILGFENGCFREQSQHKIQLFLECLDISHSFHSQMLFTQLSAPWQPSLHHPLTRTMLVRGLGQFTTIVNSALSYRCNSILIVRLNINIKIVGFFCFLFCFSFPKWHCHFVPYGFRAFNFCSVCHVLEKVWACFIFEKVSVVK